MISEVPVSNQHANGSYLLHGLSTPVLGIILVVTLLASFSPTIVALARGHKDKKAIIIGNILLIWSFEAWIPLLIWASTGNKTSGLLDNIKTSRSAQLKAGALGVLMLLAVVVGIRQSIHYL